jgi:glycosyltransferase involved in cell wall biosynthesis
MRLLFICHNHPELQPGGTETVARSLFRELCDQHGHQGLFLAAVTEAHRPRPAGTLFQGIGPYPDEVLVWLGHFDRFGLSQPDCYGLASLGPMIAAQDPEVIHIHHPLLFGLETIDLLRRMAPRAALIFTAHDYFALCPREGELLTTDGRLCSGPRLDACHACFPGVDLMELTLRDLQIRDALADIDHMLLPSHFARQRYLAAGWPAERMTVLRNGIAAVPAAPYRYSPDGHRDRFGFFGHISRIKGSRVLLRASAGLSAQGVEHRLDLHGGTEWQTEEHLAGFRADLAAAPAARHHGRYEAEQLPGLMAEVDWVVMPSIWWENAPLVILEAFRHRRPVICSGIGGMAEMVRDRMDGLHAPVDDPVGLAAVLHRAVTERGLWAALAQGIRPPLDVAGMAEAHLTIYAEALAARAAPTDVPDEAADEPAGPLPEEVTAHV